MESREEKAMQFRDNLIAIAKDEKYPMTDELADKFAACFLTCIDEGNCQPYKIMELTDGYGFDGELYNKYLIEKAILATSHMAPIYSPNEGVFVGIMLFSIRYGFLKKHKLDFGQAWVSNAFDFIINKIVEEFFYLLASDLPKEPNKDEIIDKLFNAVWKDAYRKHILKDLFYIKKKQFKKILVNSWNFADSFDMGYLWEVWNEEQEVYCEEAEK